MNTETNHTAERHYEFDVSLSFAEEDRAFVDRVARHLKSKDIRLFYDKYAMVDTWGRNLYEHLDNIYQRKARYCVLFISKHYKAKLWTNHERESAQARAFRENEAYILPFRFDDTEIAGLRDTIAYLSVNKYNEKQLAEAIIKKISQIPAQQTNPEPVATVKAKIGLTRIQRLQRAFYKYIPWIASGIVLITLMAFGLKDKLTPVPELAEKIHERSKKKAPRAVCRDGWLSKSHGPGTCSHHKGVDHYTDTLLYDKSVEACQKEAEEISWITE